MILLHARPGDIFAFSDEMEGGPQRVYQVSEDFCDCRLLYPSGEVGPILTTFDLADYKNSDITLLKPTKFEAYK